MHFMKSFLFATFTTLALSAPRSVTKRTGNFTWFGINESGAEFGSGNIPGVLGTDYTWPLDSSVDTLIGEGFNFFRIPFLMERLIPNSMSSGTFATEYLSDLTALVTHITDNGAYAAIDPHNYGRYYGDIITSTSDFQAFWTSVAGQFSSNSKVIFDCNNEFHDEPSTTLVEELNQACVDGVRAAGATSQYIFLEGTQWTGAWSWVSSGNAAVMGNVTDTENKAIYEMHQYLDSDSSGTSDVCVSSTIGSERLEVATEWLRSNGKLGFLGEYAGGSNSVCEEAVEDLLQYLVDNNDVWLGASWWAGGPWGDYIFSFEPPSGIAYENYLSILESYK